MKKCIIQCIYCPTLFDPTRGQGDHVLPHRLFGEFEGDTRFRRACNACNNKFGEFEQVLSQSSPWGFYRTLVEPNLGRRQGRGGLTQRGSKGGKRPKRTMEFDGREFLVESSELNAFDGITVAQIVVEDEKGQFHQVRLYPNMASEQLESKILALGIERPKSFFILGAGSTENDSVFKALKRIYPKISLQSEGEMPNETVRSVGTINFEFSIGYFQALAKIGFHYYLNHSNRGYRGDEPIFSDIRDFICNGGDKSKFFHSSGIRFFMPFDQTLDGKRLCPVNWSHITAANERNGKIVVYLHLFIGPKCITPPIYITLGETANNLILPQRNGVWGHIYEYELGRKGRFAGTVRRVAFDRVVRTR